MVLLAVILTWPALSVAACQNTLSQLFNAKMSHVFIANQSDFTPTPTPKLALLLPCRCIL